MKGSKARLERMVWCFLLSAAVACLASGAALATCHPSLSGITPGDGDIPCFVEVQPIDVCPSSAGCAPFNTLGSGPSGAGMPTNETSPNPIGFTVDPNTGVGPPPSGDNNGRDITRALLNNIGVDLIWDTMAQYPTTGTTFNTVQVTQGAVCIGHIDNAPTSGSVSKGMILTITSCTFGIPAVGDSLTWSGSTGVTTITGSAIATAPGATACGTCTGGGVSFPATYQVSQQLKVASTTITSTSTLLQSRDFLTLSQQFPNTARPPNPTPPNPPCAVSQMTIPPSSPCGAPSSPLGGATPTQTGDPSIVNMFFVNNLKPPVYSTTCTGPATSCPGGTLYGFSWQGHNGVAIGGNTFSPNAPLQARPSTIAHELLHNLGLTHNSYGAGPYNPPSSTNPFPPGGTAPPISANPLAGDCSTSTYPACAANLMTAGSIRTESTVACILAPLPSSTFPTPGTPAAACLPAFNTNLTAQSPSLETGTAGQVTPLPPFRFYFPPPNFLPTAYPPATATCSGSISGTTLMISGCSSGALWVSSVLSGSGIATTPAPGTFITAFGPNTSGGAGTYTVNISQTVGPETITATTLPTPQQAAVLSGGSGLLQVNSNNPNPNPNSAFLNGIPHETTQAQLGTSGDTAGRAVFDLSGPAGGKPGETLVAWVLTLPEQQTFAGHDRFEIVSQSRKNLIKGVHYYPEVETHPLLRNIAYGPGAGNNPGNPSVGTAADGPCASAAAECLMVEFQPPGLGANDSISFSKSILSGGAPIAKDDLCKAKITYVFSDGYATTSNLRPCPAASLPLIASSWRPDPRVSPHKVKTDMLLAQRGVVLASAPAPGHKIPPGNDPGNNNPPPAGPILDLSGTPIPGGGNNTYQSYTVNFTAAFSNTAITFAFRDDPAFISFSNASVTDTAGGSNLLTNGNFSGGNYTNNGNSSTPVGWTYANMYGATFGGVGASGFWYDGAVQAYDAISQTIATTPGHLYQISFSVAENSGCGTCNFSDLSTNGDQTDTGGNGINVTVYAQAGLPPAIAGGPWTPNPNNPNQPLFAFPAQAGCADCDPVVEGGQLGRSCNNTATSGPDVHGIIKGNVTVSAGQQCNFNSPCEIQGNLTINGGTVTLNCQVDGNVTDNAGILTLGSSAHVEGNVSISGASAFNIGPSVQIDGNLQIQSAPTGTQQAAVCGTTVKGNLTVQNNKSPIQIGGTKPIGSCTGNAVSGNLVCSSNNPMQTSGGNSVAGHNQCPSG
jgi:hypothetical protein